MAKKRDRLFWAVRTKAVENLRAHELIDILRHECSRVHTSNVPGFYVFSSDGAVLHAGRLRSFGVEVVAEVWGSREDYNPPSEMSEALHRLKEAGS